MSLRQHVVNYAIKLIGISGFTHPEIETLAKVPMGSISRWILNKREPSITNLEKVLNSLGYRLTVIPIERDILICDTPTPELAPARRPRKSRRKW